MADDSRAKLNLETNAGAVSNPGGALRNTLRAGDTYGDFFIQTIDGRVLDIDTFKGQKIWVALYRYGGCPMCATHFTEVVSARETLERNGVAFIAVFDCAANRIPNWVQKSASRSLYIVGEGSDQLQTLFGSERSWSKLLSIQSAWARIKAAAQGHFEYNISGAIDRVPAHFLIGTDGRVEVAHYGNHAGDHVSWKAVQDFFKGNTVPPAKAATTLAPATVKASASAPPPAAVAPKLPRVDPEQTGPKVFVALYRYRVHTGQEAEFANEWKRLEAATADLFPAYLGSTLHFSTMNEWIVYAVWKTRADWEVYEVTQGQTQARRQYAGEIIEREADPIFMCVQGQARAQETSIKIFDDEKTESNAKIS